MKYQNEELYNKLEIDIADTMDRFMNNESMFTKFLAKFANNTQFAELRDLLNEQKWEDALMTSHNLKSFTGNLSLTKLHELLTQQVKDLRENNLDFALSMMDKIDEEREHVLSVLKEFHIY